MSPRYTLGPSGTWGDRDLPEGEEDRGRAGIVSRELRHSPREDLLEARTVAGRAKEGGMRGPGRDEHRPGVTSSQGGGDG